MKRIFKCLVLLGIVGMVLLGAVVVLARAMIIRGSTGHEYSAVDAVPKNKVGLVLGCVPRLSNGRANSFFTHRMTAALELYQAEKVEYLLVSGDNHHVLYDEPTAMKAALVAAGVPADRVVCDYAGFRTLDSVVRANKVFLEDSFTVVSQRFHNQRAIYIGRAYGLEVVGYNARDVRRRWSIKTRLREQLARVKTVLDIYVLHQKPKFLGDTIPIGGDADLVRETAPCEDGRSILRKHFRWTFIRFCLKNRA